MPPVCFSLAWRLCGYVAAALYQNPYGPPPGPNRKVNLEHQCEEYDERF
jgi:hypothetical protein